MYFRSVLPPSEGLYHYSGGPEATKFLAGPPEHWVAVVRQATIIFQHKIV